MQNFSSMKMALAMIAAFLLAAGGVKLVPALVMITNVMIWTV